MPAQRRALVLGAAGFLGSACTKELLAQRIAVTAFFRDPPADTARLFDQCKIIRGDAEDGLRLRQIIAIHEIDVVFQCAAADTPAETHGFTRALLGAVAAVPRKPLVVVPLRASASTSQPRFQSLPDAGLKVLFARLPDLFGPRCCPDCWPATLFHRAVAGLMLLPPPRNVFTMDVGSAATALVDAALDMNADYPATGRWLDMDATATSRELWHAVKDELGPRLYGEATALQDAVRTTLAWQRTQSDDEVRLRAAA